MADKKVIIKDQNGNSIYPKTYAELVENSSGQNLGTVEAGAQVNKLEKITVNGQEVTITDKTAAITISEGHEYSIQKLGTAESGYSATYQLTKDGTKVGDSINIPKDLVVESGSVKTCETADEPVVGYKLGDKYIDLVLANSNDEHIYILVSDLVDVYTAGEGIKITGNVISVDTSVVATQEDLDEKQDELTAEQLAAVNSGITVAKVSTYDGYSATIALKANAADVYTKQEIAGMNLLTFSELA